MPPNIITLLPKAQKRFFSIHDKKLWIIQKEGFDRSIIMHCFFTVSSQVFVFSPTARLAACYCCQMFADQGLGQEPEHMCTLSSSIRYAAFLGSSSRVCAVGPIPSTSSQHESRVDVVDIALSPSRDLANRPIAGHVTAVEVYSSLNCNNKSILLHFFAVQ